MQYDTTGGSSVGPLRNTSTYKLFKSVSKIGVAPAATPGMFSSTRTGRDSNVNGAAPLSPLNTIGRPDASLIVHNWPSVRLFMIQDEFARYAAGNCAHSMTRSCQVTVPAGVAALTSQIGMPLAGLRMPVGLPLPSP